MKHPKSRTHWILIQKLSACLAGFLIGLLATPEVSSGGSAQVEPTRLNEWLNSFVSQYSKTKTLNDLVAKFPMGISRPDSRLLTKLTGTTTPLPKLAFDPANRSLKFGDRLTVRIRDVAAGEFLVNGVPYRFLTDRPFIINYINLIQLRPKSGWDPIAAFTSLLLPEAKAEFPSYNPDLDDWYENLIGYSDVADAGMSALLVYVANKISKSRIVKGAGAVSAFALTTLISYLTYKAEAYLANPSCRAQVDHLREILREQKLGLASLDCGYHVRLSDRSIEFWEKSPEGYEKTLFKADWDAAVAWSDDDKVYRFNNDGLIEVREMTGNSRKKIGPRDREFQAESSYIERYRKVLFYLGSHRSCYKCEEDIRKNLITDWAPDYLDADDAPSGKKNSDSTSVPVQPSDSNAAQLIHNVLAQ